MKKIITTCLVALVPLVSTYGQELLTNPGFEDPDGAGPLELGDGWGSFGAAGFNAFFGANGHASLFADTPGNSGGVFQTGIAATEGFEYTLNLTDFLVEDNFGGDLSITLEFYQVDDSTQISSVSSDFSLAIADPAPAPGTLTVTATAPALAEFVRPLISFSNAVGTEASSENVFVFDASLTAVPEPSVAALALGLVSLGFVATRRRK